jgi:hypothetical protein
MEARAHLAQGRPHRVTRGGGRHDNWEQSRSDDSGMPEAPELHPRTKRRFSSERGGMIALAFPETAFAGETGPPPNVTILIYNYAQATHSVLAGAERKAGRIFAAAGISALGLSVLWCPRPPAHKDPVGALPKAKTYVFSCFQLQ